MLVNYKVHSTFLLYVHYNVTYKYLIFRKIIYDICLKQNGFLKWENNMSNL